MCSNTLWLCACTCSCAAPGTAPDAEVSELLEAGQLGLVSPCRLLEAPICWSAEVSAAALPVAELLPDLEALALCDG